MNLKKVRLDKNMTQKDVADRLGCTPNIYSRYETGERQPSIDTLIRLSQIFEKSIDYLVENHAEVDLSISKEEQELLQAYRNADDRAREDALNTLLSHPLEKKNSLKKWAVYCKVRRRIPANRCTLAFLPGIPSYIVFSEFLKSANHHFLHS